MAMPVHEAPIGLRSRLSARGVSIELMCVAVGSVVLTLLAPYGILGASGWSERLAYWARTLLVGYLVYRPLVRLAGGAAVRMALPEWSGWAGALVMASAPFSLWLWWFGPEVDLSRAAPSAGLLIETAGQVLIVSALVAACLWFAASLAVQDGTDSEAQPDAEPLISPAADQVEPPQRSSFMARLPRRLGREVWALKGEDHYLRVFTATGDALVLMRMTDAVAELGGVPGLQVHRSWWVAEAALESVAREARRLELRLKNGLKVPVARDRVAALRRAGWTKF